MSNILINLTKRGWALSVLAALAQGHLARAHPMAKALQTSPISIKAAVDHLICLQLVLENPGHGHPLRPEYVLTPLGEILGAKAQGILDYGSKEGVLPLLRKRWTLPIVGALDAAKSFSELRRSLTPCTDRALSLSLKDMTGAKLVRRKVLGHQRPPVSLYMPTPKLMQIRPHLDAFIRQATH